MLRRIKYRLLRWLLDDICIKSDCKDCYMYHEINIDGYLGCACRQDDILRLARRAWNMMYPWEEDVYGTDDE